MSGRGRARARRGRSGRATRSASVPNLQNQVPDVSSSAESASEEVTDASLMRQRIGILERQIKKLKEPAARSQSPPPTCSPRSRSSSPSSSSRSSSSDSSSSPERRRRSKRRRSSSGNRSSSKKQWKNPSYGHQYAVNRKVLKLIGKARKTSSRQKAKTSMLKGERVLKERQEWLMIAEHYGANAASHYEEGGELLELVSSSGKKKRLMAALQAEGTRVRLAEQTRQKPQPSDSHAVQSMPANFSSSVAQKNKACHLCGQVGHFIRFCPHSQVSGRSAASTNQ